ncbi:MAG: hypothetical protein ACKOA6_01785, partial [Actinomycetota bacterium]
MKNIRANPTGRGSLAPTTRILNSCLAGVWPLPATIASPWLRLAAYLLEAVLQTVTLGIGWLIWAAIVAGNGQTPAKQLLRMRVVGASEPRPVGFAR